MESLESEQVNSPPAVFSADRRYRYWLQRRLSLDPGVCVFGMLNGSTANETDNDPTVTRCCNFARGWGFGTLIVVNAFALCATDPRELYKADDPVGPENDRYLRSAAAISDRFIVAWGNHGALKGRDKEVLEILRSTGVAAYHFGLTKRSQPRHPLYVRADRPLEVMS